MKYTFGVFEYSVKDNAYSNILYSFVIEYDGDIKELEQNLGDFLHGNLELRVLTEQEFRDERLRKRQEENCSWEEYERRKEEQARNSRRDT